MSHQLPITLCLFTSTRGHHSRKTDWLLTLNHWDKQVPLALFGARVAHVKVTPSDETLATDMRTQLESRGFHVITTVGDWSRGLSHGFQYLQDQIRVSMEPLVYTQPYLLFLEDDSVAVSHVVSLENLLMQACAKLAARHDLLTVRLRRRADDRGPAVETPDEPDTRWFYSSDTNFQPLVMRVLDFERLCMALESHPEACQTVQCERLWKLVFDHFNRSPRKHLVYECDYAETIHLGVPTGEHEAACLAAGITPL